MPREQALIEAAMNASGNLAGSGAFMHRMTSAVVHGQPHGVLAFMDSASKQPSRGGTGTTIDPIDSDAQIDTPCTAHPAGHPAVLHHSPVRVPIAGTSSTHQTPAAPSAEAFSPVDQIVANDASGRAPPYFFRLA